VGRLGRAAARDEILLVTLPVRRLDIVKAFEVLGDVVALRGNLSPSMMTTGTPQEVDAAVKHLVANVWEKGGSLILDTAFGIPDETPVANVRAMFDAARKYAG
jgi:uroporphyrinogen-III decarboxylase